MSSASSIWAGCLYLTRLEKSGQHWMYRQHLFQDLKQALLIEQDYQRYITYIYMCDMYIHMQVHRPAHRSPRCHAEEAKVLEKCLGEQNGSPTNGEPLITAWQAPGEDKPLQERLSDWRAYDAGAKDAEQVSSQVWKVTASNDLHFLCCMPLSS